MKKEKIAIVGAGLAGSLLAIYLARKGYQVDVHERRPDIRQETANSGRSINLALSVRGLHALAQVGIKKQLKDLMIPMTGRMIHRPGEPTELMPYGKDSSEVINSISRSDLTCLLINEAEKYENVRFHFADECIGVDLARGRALMRDGRSGKKREIQADSIIGTDGAGSAVRRSMLHMPRFDFSQSFLQHSYKELILPAAPDGGFRIEKHALHIWPKGGYMFIALPNLDGSFTCTLFLYHEGELSFASLDTPDKVQSFFERDFPDAAALFPNLTEEFFRNPVGHLATVKCFPWHWEDKALILGDAAHAIVPFYGQGMNCAFEDCAILSKFLDKHPDDWARAFADYSKARKPDTDAIADLALDNFVEMRDSVANPKFALKRQLEHRLEDAFPGDFISKYSMVTFHRTPYKQAMELGRKQDSVLEAIVAELGSIEEVDLAAVKAQLASKS